MNDHVDILCSTRNTPPEAQEPNHGLATLGLFAAGIAHEFNNLMTPASAAAQAALACGDPDAARVTLQRVLDAVQQAQRIGETILRMAGGKSLRVEDGSLREIVEAAIAISRMELAKSRVRVVLDVPADATIRVEPSALLHVLLNLIVNARRAMAGGGGVLKLLATPSQPRDQRMAWVLQVVDTGRGMTPDQTANALDPFTGRQRSEGTGIGLPLCKQLIGAFGGEITIDSTPGRGTTVRLTLPAAATAPSRAAA